MAQERDVEDCTRHVVSIGGENYYLLVGDEFVLCTVPRENDVFMSQTRETVETLCENITMLMKQRKAAAQLPEGYVMVPAALTAENGAKAAMMGEFFIQHTTETCYSECCDECDMDECNNEKTLDIQVDWTTIKRIYKKAVSLFAPKEEPCR